MKSWTSMLYLLVGLAACSGGKTSTGVEDATANWNTYKNDTYGYEVKYPDNWQVGGGIDSEVKIMEVDGQDWSGTISVLDKSLVEAEAALPLLSVPGRKIDSRTNITVNGINWIKLVVDESQIAQLTYYNGKTYVIAYETLNGDMSTKIVSTFKFTDKDETVNWKTYTNTQYGFQLKHPPDYDLLTFVEEIPNLVVQVGDPKARELGIVNGLAVYVEKQPFEVSGKIYPTVEEFVNNFFKTDTLRTVYLGSDKFVEVAMVNIEMEPLKLRTLFTIKDDYLFTIMVSLDKDFTKVLNSFRFTK